MKVVLCICTYRRPDGLLRLLKSLPLLQHSASLSVVISDNHADQEGLAAARSLPPDYPLNLHCISELNAGISAARNSATSKALELQPELVAFLDDDEWPEPQWLAELMRIQSEQAADAVGGPTLPEFPPEAPEHLRNNTYYGASLNLPDGSSCQLEAGGNFLIKASVLQKYSPAFFHPSFAHSGGEDLAFFKQLSQDGHTMAWAANAIVHEPVSESRLAEGWLKERIINIHNSRVRVMQMLEPGILQKLVRGIKTIGLGSVAILLSGAALLIPSYRESARMMRWKFRGKLSAHLGRSIVRGETY